MKIQTSNYDIGYPIYGARFLRKDMLLVAGGGGVGVPDVPNKLTALRINFDKKKVLKRYREITLDSSDDCPSNLDVAQQLILMGCNEGSEKIQATGQNHHLRKFMFQDEHLKFMGAIDFNGSTDPQEYTKLICIARDTTIAAIASSRIPTVIRIIDPQDMTEKYEIEVGREVRDLHFSPDGKVMAYVTPSSLEIVSVVTGRFIYRKTDFSPNWYLSRVRFINDNELVLATTISGKNSISLTKFVLQNDKVSILMSKQVFKNYKAITAMEVNHDGSVIAMATDDNSLALIKSKNLSVLKLVNKIHTDTITRVAFSPASEYVVSVSTDCNIRIYKLPANLGKGSGFFATLFRIIRNLVLLSIFVGCSYLVYINDLHITAYNFVQKQIQEKRANAVPSSDVFDYGRSTTIMDDIVSVITQTEDPQTGFIEDEDEFDDSNMDDYYNQDITTKSIHMGDIYDENQIVDEIINDNSASNTVEEIPLHSKALEEEIIRRYESSVTEEKGNVIKETLQEEPLQEEPLQEEILQGKPIKKEAIQEDAIQEESLQDKPTQKGAIQEEVVQEETIQEKPLQDEPVQKEAIQEEPLLDKPIKKELMEEGASTPEQTPNKDQKQAQTEESVRSQGYDIPSEQEEFSSQPEQVVESKQSTQSQHEVPSEHPVEPKQSSQPTEQNEFEELGSSEDIPQPEQGIQTSQIAEFTQTSKSVESIQTAQEFVSQQEAATQLEEQEQNETEMSGKANESDTSTSQRVLVSVITRKSTKETPSEAFELNEKSVSEIEGLHTSQDVDVSSQVLHQNIASQIEQNILSSESVVPSPQQDSTILSANNDKIDSAQNTASLVNPSTPLGNTEEQVTPEEPLSKVQDRGVDNTLSAEATESVEETQQINDVSDVPYTDISQVINQQPSDIAEKIQTNLDDFKPVPEEIADEEGIDVDSNTPNDGHSHKIDKPTPSFVQNKVESMIEASTESSVADPNEQAKTQSNSASLESENQQISQANVQVNTQPISQQPNLQTQLEVNQDMQ